MRHWLTCYCKTEARRFALIVFVGSLFGGFAATIAGML